jgi:acyl phosphate:glycerol-3-phosphate acyltransferase
MLIWLVLAAYLLGSLPFGLIVAGLWNVDIRRHGSGNIGATNVLRTLGPAPAVAVFALDFAKGWLAVYIGNSLGVGPLVVVFLGAAVVLGHMYSLFLKFKGGKGAATGLGVLVGLSPEVFAISLVVAAVIIYATRYVSVGSIVTPFVAAGLLLLFHRPLPYIIVTLIVGLFILIRHLPNIQRLRRGTEPRI